VQAAKSREPQPIDLDLGPTPLLGWLPGETLFSHCSRQHEFWGHAHAWTTASMLFGARRAGTQHDFPSHLDRFAQATGERLGSSRTIVEERTLLRYYRPFVSEAVHEDAIAAMRSKSVAHLKYRLGLLTSRFRANHPLKACRRCMRVDVEEHGWPYWHLEHQYPGVWFCLTHDFPLDESVLKSTGVDRFQWVLPVESSVATRRTAISQRTAERLKSLATMIVQIVRAANRPGWLHVERLREIALRAIRSRGWSTETGRLRLRDISGEFEKYCVDLAEVPELRSLPRNIDAATVQVGRLLRPMRTGTHPLRYLALIDWLYPTFDDLRAAIAAVEAESPIPGAPPRQICPTPSGHPRRQLRKDLMALLREGAAVSAAAREVGIDVATAMAWAAQEEIVVARRPSILTPGVRRKLVRQLEKGTEKKVAAEDCGISESSVNRILRTVIGLQSKWRMARERAARNEARRSWLRALKMSRGQGMKLTRSIEPAAYAWLYRNDRAWLEANLPDRLPRSSRTFSHVSWDERDRELKTKIQVTVLELAEERPSRRIKLWEIYQRIPELKAKLHQLDRLPLSRKALDITVRGGARLKGHT
jgi:hypothetical protein